MPVHIDKQFALAVHPAPSSDSTKARIPAISVRVLQDFDLKRSPQLVLLRKPDEDPTQLMDALPEQLLLRWLNHHLSQPSSNGESAVWSGSKPVGNFSRHLADGVAALGLMHSLAPEVQLRCR